MLKVKRAIHACNRLSKLGDPQEDSFPISLSATIL